MEYDYSVFYQKPNNWLPTHVEYSGEGKAEFLKPKGKISGHTQIIFDEFGENIFEMQVEDWESENPLPAGLPQLLSGIEPRQIGETWTLIWPPPKYNLCTRLFVKTDTGEFIAENIDMLSFSERWDEEGIHYRIQFFPRVSRFDVQHPNSAKYWIMPLVNFISQFMQSDGSLAHHPLRIYPDVDVSANIPEEFKQRAAFIATARSRFILFDFKGSLGFIEALSDYEEKEQRLMKHQIPSAITAVMIGLLGDNPIDVDEFEQWFPFHFLDLLSLATGNEVNTPWIEFRDEYGNLVRRIHAVGFRYPLFLEGQRAIDEIHHHGTGRLLTVSQSCTELHESYLQAAMRYTILGGRNEQVIEDRLAHFCRALDVFCEKYGLSEQYLLSLTQKKEKIAIREAINKSRQIIESFKKKAEKSGSLAQARYLNSAIGILSNVFNKKNDFGLAVCDLLRKFNFPDADILDAFFNDNPHNYKITPWASLVSHYRGRVIHIGYFNYKTKEHEIRDIDTVTLHLHDILIRIIFVILGYDGKYGPIMKGPSAEEQINWVGSGSSAQELGYKK